MRVTSRSGVALGVVVAIAVASPSQAGLVVLDLRADVGVNKAPSTPAGNGDVVTEWKDQSGQGHDATLTGVSVSSIGPTYSTADPSVQFPQTVAGGDNHRRLTL